MRWQAGDYQILWEIGERGLSKEIKFNPKVMLCPNCRQVSTFLVNFSRFHSISFKSTRDFISKARGWVKKSEFPVLEVLSQLGEQKDATGTDLM